LNHDEHNALILQQDEFGAQIFGEMELHSAAFAPTHFSREAAKVAKVAKESINIKPRVFATSREAR
jgi:hypothetical protein